jgi:hypothetical protein
MSSAFLMWCPKCRLFSSICCRERRCSSVMHMSVLFLSGSFTVYLLRKIGLIRTVVNIACMPVGLISATCLGRRVETECKQHSNHYNKVHNTTHVSTKDPRTCYFLKIWVTNKVIFFILTSLCRSLSNPDVESDPERFPSDYA